MNDLVLILKSYAAFENRLREKITAGCSYYCRDCPNVCCKAVFCEDSVQSVFLTMLRERQPPKAQYSGKTGWLAPGGCALFIGRPPVCYEFFCYKISRDNPRLEKLGRLIRPLGKNALGPRHLLHLDGQELRRVKFSRFAIKLREAEMMLGEL